MRGFYLKEFFDILLCVLIYCINIWIIFKELTNSRVINHKPSIHCFSNICIILLVLIVARDTHTRIGYLKRFYAPHGALGSPSPRREYQDARFDKFKTRGSPPPTRGTPASTSSASSPFRLTPAYAGNTPTPSHWQSILKAHPRLRGEHPIQRGAEHGRPGSPPPTRGTLRHSVQSAKVLRLTPAYAGNTQSAAKTRTACRAHPCLRGEHVLRRRLRLIRPGSPPPTRGTLHLGKVAIRALRLTPAYAGNTLIKSKVIDCH